MLPCRLCGGPTAEAFRAIVLLKHDVAYHRCAACGSLQTDVPTWLDEAYSGNNLILKDTGAAGRNLSAQAIVYAVARILGLWPAPSLLDWGGGNGLLGRLLRDRGFDARVFDEYAVNDFAQGFEDDGSQRDIVCAFDVAEHFAHPKEEMKRLLDRARSLCIVGTDSYEGQGPDWPYLAPSGGQHVFFYSPTGMAKLAAANDCHYHGVHNVHLFLRRPFRPLEKRLLSLVIPERNLRWVRAYLAYSLSYDHAKRDAGAESG
jgi:hypothetical protein